MFNKKLILITLVGTIFFGFLFFRSTKPAEARCHTWCAWRINDCWAGWGQGCSWDCVAVFGYWVSHGTGGWINGGRCGCCSIEWCQTDCCDENNWWAISGCDRSCGGGYQLYQNGCGDQQWRYSGCNPQSCNSPPNTPSLSAPPHNTWINYAPTFSASSCDPNGNNIHVYFSLGGWGGWVGSCGTSSVATNVGDTGGYWWNAIAQDSVGAYSGWSGSWLLLKDTGAPALNYLSVSSGSSWVNYNPTWSWSFSDSLSGLRSPNRYYYYLDGVAQGYTDSTAWAPNLSNGAHSVYVYAIDNAGNWGGSGWVTGYVDKTAPSASISNNTGGSWVNWNPTWSWSASDATSGLRGSSRYYVLTRYQWGGWNGDWYTDATSWSANAGSNGEYEVYVYAIDNAGNWGGAPAWSYAYVDKTVPSISLSVSPTSWTNGNPTWSWSASDSGGSGLRGSSRYYYYLDGAGQGYTDSTSWAPSLANGSHYVQVYAIDNAGNWGLSNSIYAYVDKTAPTASISNNTGGSWVNWNPTWSWSGSDSGGSGLRGSSRYYILTRYNWGGWNGDWYTDATSWSANAGSNGEYEVYVYAIDNAGNWGGAPAWSYAYVDKTAPTVNLTVNTPAAWVNYLPTWSWTGSDGGSGLRTTNTYYLYLDGVDTGLRKNVGDALSYTPATLTDGSHYLKVCAYDNSGLNGCSANVTVQIDRTLPVITSLTSSYVPLSNSARWDWSASDAGGSLLRVTNTYAAELTGPSGTTTTYTNNPYFQINSVPDGTYSLRVHAYDSAGNQGLSGWSTVIVDTCPLPTIPGSVRETHGGCTHDNPIWAWEASTTMVGVIDYYDVAPSWTTNVKVYSPTLTYAPIVTGLGTYAIKVRSHNSCGKFSDYSPLAAVAVDKLAPACQIANNFTVSWNQPTDPGVSCGPVNDYWIQLSENSTVDADGNFQTVLGPEFNKVFTLPAVAGRVTYLTDVTTYLTTSPKTFYFHVKGKDPAGNFSGWSPTISVEVKKVPAITSLNITNISPFPLTPNTTNFSVTADINLSVAGAICTACSRVCEAWKITRGVTTPVNYTDTEVCTNHTEAPTFTVTTPFSVLAKLPAGFNDGDYLSVRATIRDCDSGSTFTREYARKVAYVSWFQALNGDVYGQSITEYVERNAAGSYESYMVANLTPDNKTTGDLPGGLAVAAGLIDVVDTVGTPNKASERTGVTGDIWALANYSPGINWPESLQTSLVGPAGGDFIHYTGAELVINSGNVSSYNGKVIYADGNITLDGSLASGPGFGSGYALTAVLIANGKIIVNDTTGPKPTNGNDMFKILGGLYAKEGIDMPRSLGNNKFPAISVTYDPGVFFKNVSGLALPQYTWREVNL